MHGGNFMFDILTTCLNLNYLHIIAYDDSTPPKDVYP